MNNEFVYQFCSVAVLRDIREDNRKNKQSHFDFNDIKGGISANALAPQPDQVTQGVGGDIYNSYRKGLDSACADVVVTTTDPFTGINYVLAGKRATGKCFGGSWWMQGGAIHAYRSIVEFVVERAAAECGVRPKIEACMALARTCAPDVNASTMQPCFVGRVDWEALKAANPDVDHSKVKTLSLSDFEEMDDDELHWYPRMMFTLALESM